ncbi:MAG: tetratricopeptide repeat protein [Candidatus Obscuribacter sp.]|jgi:tetratricopeptide (TPR) repeat protein|nr:tetratricopeptide repeat protein [Candidatus Obscuribacter sp.]MDQ5965342.1 Tetratricopeptide repeat protein [Cyanobacteriota bacterium erpe_2018_sw_39hr_WHONDRS-SW48-000098_B_bin.30]MBK7839659.1 tetratricopeptide repeat protein [Candidatus Obscuribacter sp.]MBK9618845.1 tetratricopeptide repeat protein [Candidatus Obscuribacter sp.]MBK9769744.1 tetratricopeptide repeat protein [Candidatus Obscuribacter sp.]
MTTSKNWEELIASADEVLRRGNYDEACQLLEEAKSQAETFEPKDPRRVTGLHKLGNALAEAGRKEEAEACHKRAVDLTVSCFGPYHQKVADSTKELASLYFENGDYVKAEELCRKMLNIYEKSLGIKHQEVGLVSRNLAMILHQQNKLDEAEKYYKRALLILQDVLNPFDSGLIGLMQSYAELLQLSGREEEADHMIACALGRVSGKMRSVTGAHLPEIS